MWEYYASRLLPRWGEGVAPRLTVEDLLTVLANDRDREPANRLGVVHADHLGLRRDGIADEVFLNALNILDTALGPDSSHSVTLRGRLAKMYDDWGKPDLAAAIRSR